MEILRYFKRLQKQCQRDLIFVLWAWRHDSVLEGAGGQVKGIHYDMILFDDVATIPDHAWREL